MAGHAGTGGMGTGGMGTGGMGTGGGPVKENDGQPCALASDCASGHCTAFYVDLDGDGYGAGQAQGFCGTTAPIGYASQSGDCCDTGTNLAIAKLIHPGATFQTTSAGGVCNITWDYDCSGTVETGTRGDCSGVPTCQDVIKTFTPDLCGTPVGQCSCDGLDDTNGNYMCSGGCSYAGILECK